VTRIYESGGDDKRRRESLFIERGGGVVERCMAQNFFDIFYNFVYSEFFKVSNFFFCRFFGDFGIGAVFIGIIGRLVYYKINHIYYRL